MATYDELADRLVLITGGANGIGQAMVEAFHAQGAAAFSNGSPSSLWCFRHPVLLRGQGMDDGPISQQCFLDHLLALASLRQIKEQAKTRWSLVESAVVHRTGFFDLGAVAVSSAHSSPAFEAGQI